MMKLILGLVAAVVLLGVAGGAGWWFFVREDDELATNAPEIPADLVQRTATPDGGAEPSPTETTGDSDGLTFRVISERSEAAYFADEKLASLPLPSKAKGSTTAITGAFHLTEDGFALDESQESSFTVDLTTLKSDEDRRDNRVQNDALQTSQFPTATFVVTGVSGVETDVAPGAETKFQLTGMLDLHGVEREIVWDVKARRDGNVITALATTTFLYEDFNITRPNIANFVTVEDDVTLQMQIVAEATS